MPQTYICRVCWGLDIGLLFLSSFGRDQQTTKSTPALPREPLRHDPGMNPRFVQTCAAQFMAILDRSGWGNDDKTLDFLESTWGE